jgi:hypothetical protein
MKMLAALTLAAIALPGCMVIPVAERPVARPVFVTPAPPPPHRDRHYRRHHHPYWR